MPAPGDRSDRARRELITAATDLVARGGFLNASVEQIGREAGLSRGAVSYHFNSKANLLSAVVDAQVEEWRALVHEVASADRLEDVLDQHWIRWSALAGSDRLLVMLLYEALGPSRALLPTARDLRARATRYFVTLLEELRVGGKVRADIDVDGAAALFVALLLGLSAHAVLDDSLDVGAAYLELRSAAVSSWT